MTLDPQREALLELIEYKDGKLFWRRRGVERIDKQFAGKEAGCVREFAAHQAQLAEAML